MIVIVWKISAMYTNRIFGNNYFLFLIFLITLFIFYIFKIFNSENITIFLILILYNLQYTIYYKYFDPILFFIILFFVKFNKNIYDINNLGKRYYIDDIWCYDNRLFKYIELWG